MAEQPLLLRVRFDQLQLCPCFSEAGQRTEHLYAVDDPLPTTQTQWTTNLAALSSLANGYFVGTINRVGIEPLGSDDFYGQSYFVDPRGQFIGGVGSPHDEELLVRDMNLDLITEVRQTWQFYRDRRPDAYGPLVED